ncbi:hypothetical protein D9758_009882 [Tetrapyrgos nigripes]|uniref:PARP catalytic domain-containing protein n=1 Tax=Tetrapyrgos nigripes TaxID=182062 RepID=A0A8H5LSG0_9AGAR|nr:hypothetical protein D9758_009882 [Tetrapyrgos nigripes]
MSTDSFATGYGKSTSSLTKSKRLVAMDHSDKAYSEVEKLFQKGWKHPEKGKPVIRAIFTVLSPQKSLDSYAEYKYFAFNLCSISPINVLVRFQVQVVNQLSNYRRRANEQLLFHGTSQLCPLGKNPSAPPDVCSLRSCSLCSIIKNSFEIRRCGTRHNFRRFGNGIYVTSCSSKADDYFSSPLRSNFRVLLVNRVIVGKPLKRKYNATSLNELPSGYNSVIGVPGGDLNYEETVVYHNDAIRPAYVVVYDISPASNEAAQRSRLGFLKSLFKTPLAS